VSRFVLAWSVITAGLLALAAPAVATYTATPGTDGTLMAGDGGADSLTVTVTDAALEHDRFGVDPGFASAQDFDTTQAGVQPLPSTYATLLTVDGGAGQDALRFIDARPGHSTDWLHAGSVTSCVQEIVGNQGVAAVCYRAATIETALLDGGTGDDRISSLDGPPTTLLTLAGGDGNDSVSQDGEDGVHVLDSPVSLIGGGGVDEASLTEDQSGSKSYSIGNGLIQGQDYAPVSYDETSEFITLYTRLGPDNRVTINETRPVSISVWSAGGTIDARSAGPAAQLVARGSLFELDAPGPINFRGGPGDDVFFGTEANDVAKGGGGVDQLNGEGGRDRLRTRDRKRDFVDCGSGRDKAKTDRKEASLRGCEVVNRPR
jgi:Ca2+-binding RTX toxin-like protein